MDNLPPAEELEVMVHELAHEMLHTGQQRKNRPRTARETEAEAVAFVVCQAISLEISTVTQDYIQLYKSDKATLAASWDRLQGTAAAVIERLVATHKCSCARHLPSGVQSFRLAA